MKHFNYLMKGMAMTLAMLVVTNVNAQVRRKTTTTTKKATTSVSTQKPVSKKPIVNTIACYETKAKSIAVGNKYIYYLEPGENNSVISINRETGEKETVIAGIAGIYEGARPRIYKIFASGDKLFFYIYTKDDFDKVYLYNGKSVESSQRLESWGRIIKTTSNRAIIVSTNYQYELWDTENLKVITNYGGKKYENGKDMPAWEDRDPLFIIASDDAIWRESKSEVVRIEKDGKRTRYGLEKEAYMAANNLKGFGHMSQNGDSLYVSSGRRVYRMNMLSPGQWEEYAKIPVNENKAFVRSYADSKGNFMTRGNGSYNYNIEYYRADALDAPKALGSSNFPSGLDVWDRTAIWWTLCPQIMVDDRDNFLFLNDAGVLYIYNPNGVNGYKKAVGTVIK